MSGEVPEGWSSRRLGDVVEIVNDGISADAIAELSAVAHYSLPAFDDGQTPEITAGLNIKSNKSLVPSNCVLFSKLNPRIPRVWRVAERSKLPSVCSTEFWPLVARSDDTDLDFLAAVVGSEAFLADPQITPSSSTNSHQRVDRRSFENYILSLPPLDEQRRIAEVLRSVDDVISIAEQSALSARAMFNRLIDDLHNRYEDNSAPLADFCVLKGLQTGPFGSQLKVSDYVDEGIPVIMPSDLRPDGINFSGAKSTSSQKADQLPQHHLKPGDILFSRRGDVEKCGLYLEGDPPAICGTGCLRARIDVSKADPVLIYFLAQSERCGSWLAQHAVGVTMPNLNTSIVGALPIPNLPLLEQRQWVEALLLAEGACRVNENYVAEAQRLKLALSADLLSGRVRVPA